MSADIFLTPTVLHLFKLESPNAIAFLTSEMIWYSEKIPPVYSSSPLVAIMEQLQTKHLRYNHKNGKTDNGGTLTESDICNNSAVLFTFWQTTFQALISCCHSINSKKK